MVLYHGSSALVSLLEPRGGSIYASHDRRSAIPFALPIRADEHGRSYWSMMRESGVPRITIHHGWLDIDAVGYVYELASAGFVQIDDWQWVCRDAVRPLAHDVVAARDYVDWIRR